MFVRFSSHSPIHNTLIVYPLESARVDGGAFIGCTWVRTCINFLRSMKIRINKQKVVAIVCAALLAIPAISAALDDRRGAPDLATMIRQRLCGLQETLGNRLRVPLIDIAVCNSPPTPTTGHLVVDKVTQPSGHARVFDIVATGTGAITGGGAGTTTDAVSKTYEVAAGVYSVSETIPGGWIQVSNTCTDVVVAEGETKTCTITNARLPQLTLVKTVTNDNGGTATTTDFQAKIDDSNVPWNAAQTVSIGAHTASETSLAGYTADEWGTDCAANGTITLAAGDNKVCTITNDDNPTPADVVINEVAWMGSMVNGTADTNAEWIELKNRGGTSANLTGWTLNAADGTPSITISDSCTNTDISAGGFFLLVRSPNNAALSADCIYPSQALGNTGEDLELRNAAASLIDSVDGTPNWEIGGVPAKGNNTTKDTAQRATDNTWFTAPPTPKS